MILKSQNCQRFIALGRTGLLIGILLFAATVPGRAQTQNQKPSLPDPVKFVNKFDIVWNVVRAVFDDMGYATELEDRKGGALSRSLTNSSPVP